MSKLTRVLDEDSVRAVWREVYAGAMRKMESIYDAPILMTEDEAVFIVRRAFHPKKSGREVFEPALTLFADRLKVHEYWWPLIP